MKAIKEIIEDWKDEIGIKSWEDEKNVDVR